MSAGLSGAQIGELVDELAPLVVGRRVREVQPLPPRDLLLILEPEEGGPIVRLRVSAGPVAARLHAQIGRVRLHHGPVGPFFRTMGEKLEGARLVALRQVDGDRIVRLDFESPAPPRPFTLLAELTGRHGNLLLLDEKGRIREILIPPPGKAAPAPRLVVGGAWTAPPGRAPSSIDSPALAATLPAPPPREGLAEHAPLSWRVECSLGDTAEGSQREEARRDLIRRLERRRKQGARLVKGLKEKEAAGKAAERIRHDGELLKGAMGEIGRGMREIEVPDYFADDAAPRAIPLDPRLSPRENVERLFARYRKHQRAAERIPAEMARALEDLEATEALVARARADDTDPEEIEAEAIAAGRLRPRQVHDPKPAREPKRRVPYLVFRGIRGSEIRVGRNARDNDALTFHESRGNDLWLHTSEAPGSHVILRLERNREPDAEELLDAAHLAIHFSPLRGTRKTGVHVALRKQVSKPKRAPAGLVTLSGGKVRMIRVEAERLERLLRGGPPPARDGSDSAT